MQSFRFRLDRILAWYRNLAGIEEARFAECYARLRHAQEAVAQLKATRLAVEHGVIRSSNVSPQDLAALGAYRLYTMLRETELEDEQKKRERALAEQREKLMAMQRQVKLLEKLRERRAEEHRYLADRELETVAEEAFASKWVREGARP